MRNQDKVSLTIELVNLDLKVQGMKNASHKAAISVTHAEEPLDVEAKGVCFLLITMLLARRYDPVRKDYW